MSENESKNVSQELDVEHMAGDQGKKTAEPRYSGAQVKHPASHPHKEINESQPNKGLEQSSSLQKPIKLLTIRSHSGLSGDMLFSGLAVLNLLELDYQPDSEEGRLWLTELCSNIMPQLADCAALKRTERYGIYGWSLDLHLPPAHEHRTLAEIRSLSHASKLSVDARNLAMTAFELLAQCEAEAHNKTIDEVHFHEVGALDSILDIFGVCELFCRLGQPHISAAPLPVADGSISCAHGILPAPAPAALKLLKGIPIRPFAGSLEAGELLTPSALALLAALPISFGPWPACIVRETALVYGQRSFPNAPNGVIFALGDALE